MNMQIVSYPLGVITAHYLRDLDTEHVALCLLPTGLTPAYAARREWLDIPELRSAGLTCPAWEVGSLCHVELLEIGQSGGAGYTLKHGPATKALTFAGQRVEELEDRIVITTTLEALQGYGVDHILTWVRGEAGVEVETVLRNHSGRPLTVELLTSFALDGLSPLAEDDGPERLALHRRYGGWSLEGKPAVHTVEQLNLDRTWFNAVPEGERYGSIGSYPVGRWFPFGAVEDRKTKVFWAAQLTCTGSWQMELTRPHDGYSFSGGLADREFGGWYKVLADGEALTAPRAFLSTAQGSLSRACQNLTSMFHRYVDAQPASEQGMPVMCNDWCAFWGAPTEEKTLRLAQVCRDHGIPYVIIDAGWTKTVHEHLGQGGNGTWELDEKKFPHGLRWLSRQLREMGLRLGIWMEFEVTTKGSPMFEAAYDPMHLRRDGVVLKNSGERSYWDFRLPEVRTYLREKVIDFLRDNEIGYLKVDYNGNLGFGCDGADSPGEGLRQQMAAVQDFFGELRRALPDLVIENCAGGGHRLEPAMMNLTALSSFSDAHECPEGPYIAANLHDLLLPRQSQIWAVLHREQGREALEYRLAAGFLGRMCLSGKLYELEPDQLDVVDEAVAFFQQAAPVIARGFSRVVRVTNDSQHHLRGLQAVIRRGDDGRILVVAHSFALDGPRALNLDLPLTGYRVQAAFGRRDLLTEVPSGLCFHTDAPYRAAALLLAPVF